MATTDYIMPLQGSHMKRDVLDYGQVKETGVGPRRYDYLPTHLIRGLSRLHLEFD